MTDDSNTPATQSLDGVNYMAIDDANFNDSKAKNLLHLKFIKEGSELKILFNVNPELKWFSQVEKYAVVKTLEQFVYFLSQEPMTEGSRQ